MCNGTFAVSKYFNKCSTYAVNEVIKSLNDEQWEAVLRVGFGSMLELRACSLPYDIFSWATDPYNIKRGYVHRIFRLSIAGMDIETLLARRGRGRGGGGGGGEGGEGGDMHIDVVGCPFSVILKNSDSDKLEERRRSGQHIRMHIVIGNNDSHLLVRKYLYTRTEELQELLMVEGCNYKKIRKLRELGLFSGVNVDMADAFGPRKDTAELEAFRSRLDSFGADNKMMEELCQFISFINERYKEGGDN
ncbi:hypothetical protein M9H77_27186 [Catharanthus roseus]|uniref:Uncharacterized protein n=1 Tax=Catharanthus roseus TaxID=4058 RepID=A0ACC0ABT3_CATRO|nr:hypothetical protein M9H77_27186 [Catharanthus roseus]